VPVELLVPEPAALGTALVQATGSDEYVASLGPLPAAQTEAEVFATLGLRERVPELREAGAPQQPPDLLELDDVRGDLHVHTDWSDGKASALEMGRAAAAL